MSIASNISRVLILALAVSFGSAGNANTASASPSIFLANGKGKAKAKAKAKAKIKEKHKKKNGKVRKGKIKRAAINFSLQRSAKLIRAASRIVREDESQRESLRNIVLHQRAARLAAKKHKVGAALWLTREARQRAREILATASTEAPTDSEDTANEWSKANEDGVATYIEQAKKLRPSKEVASALSETKKLVVEASAAVKEGGKGKVSLGKAIGLQKAARRAGMHGKDQAALEMTAKAREEARAALSANGVEAPADDGETYDDAELAPESYEAIAEVNEDVAASAYEAISVDPIEVEYELDLEE